MKKRTREVAAPDITPLIDVVFLLLIFFMVSTVFKKDELALLLSLPETSKGNVEKQNQKNIYIELSPTEIAFNGQQTTLDKIEEHVSKITKKSTPIDLRIDKTVQYYRFVKLLDKLKKYELTNLSLITDN